MYKIGEFSKITNLTIKTLRYYDEVGILCAQKKDNGYRIYDEKDYEIARRILMLKSLDFSIQEIKDVFNTIENENDLQYFLLEKRQMIIDSIEDKKRVINTINTYLQSDSQKGEESMSYQVLRKDIEEIRVAYVSYKGRYSDIGQYIGKVFKVVKNKAVGETIACYFDGEYKEEAEIEVCVPVQDSFVSNNNEVKVKTLPSIQALTTIHKGRYDAVGEGYKAVIDYAKESNIQLETPTREVYIKGPGMILKGNPNKYITEIVIPIKE